MKDMTKEKFEKLDGVTTAAIKAGGKLLFRTGYGHTDSDYVVRDAAVVTNPGNGEEAIVIFHPTIPGVALKKHLNTILFRMAPKEPERRTVYLNLYSKSDGGLYEAAGHLDHQSAMNGKDWSPGIPTLEVHLAKDDGGNWQVDKES